MTSLLTLDKKQMEKLNCTISVLEDANGKEVYFVAPVTNNSCDKYDCWFGDIKCTCEGICDGRN